MQPIGFAMSGLGWALMRKEVLNFTDADGPILGILGTEPLQISEAFYVGYELPQILDVAFAQFDRYFFAFLGNCGNQSVSKCFIDERFADEFLQQFFGQGRHKLLPVLVK
jgi:hypothetical protein